MKINEYQEWTLSTAQYPEAGTGSNAELAYLALGLGESGEVQGKIKKILRGDADPEKLKQLAIAELGDILWYVARIASALNVPLEQVMLDNYFKLEERKRTGVIKGSGDVR